MVGLLLAGFEVWWFGWLGIHEFAPLLIAPYTAYLVLFERRFVSALSELSLYWFVAGWWLSGQAAFLALILNLALFLGLRTAVARVALSTQNVQSSLLQLAGLSLVNYVWMVSWLQVLTLGRLDRAWFA